MIYTKFWLNHPAILYENNSMLEIFPSRKFDIIRKLNAIFRLSIYYSIIMYFYKKENKYLMIIPVVGALTFIIYHRQKNVNADKVMNQSMSDKLDDLVKVNDLQTECRIPTKDNPFMNPTLTDYNNNLPSVPKSCPSYNNIGVQRRVEEMFNDDLYRDVNDIFGKNNSQRQFYTVPGNQVPNDQHSFGQWLYGTPPSCKEGNKEACLAGAGTTGVMSKS